MKITSFIIALLVFFNILLLYQKSNLKTKTIKWNNDTKEFLELIDGQEPKGKGVATLYIFYHADEKCGCLEDWKNWVAIHEMYSPAIRVKGIFNGTNINKFRLFNEGFGIPFPTYLDRDSYLRKQYLVPSNTTAKVLVSPGGYILLSDVYEDNSRDQHFFFRRLKMHCDRILDQS